MTARSEIFKTTLVVICLILSTNIFSQNFWQQTNGPYGGSATDFYYNQITHKFFCFSSCKIYKCNSDSNNWQRISTPFYPDGFAVSPEGVFFCSTFEDRLYKSSDEGLSWEHIGFEIPVYLSRCNFVFTKSGIVLLGEDGIYRSTNNGYNWENVLNSTIMIMSMVVNNNGDIYAGTLWEGLYKSTNEGSNWSLIAFQNISIYGLTVNSKGYIFAASDGKIRRSTNNGESWEIMISGIVTQTFAMFTDSNDNIYAGTETQRVLESTDDGVTWFFKNRGLYNRDVISFGEYEGNIYCGTNGKGINKFDGSSGRWIVNNKNVCGSYVNSVAVHPSGRVFAHVNNDGVYYSDDNGISWISTGLNDTLSTDHNSSFAFDSTGNIFTLNNAALYKSTDNGELWFRIPSSPNIGFGDLYISPNGMLFISNGSGLFSSSNSGLNWVRNNGFSYLVAFNINSEGILFGSWQNQIYISTDNGNSWISRGMFSHGVEMITFDIFDNVYAGTCDYGIYKSTNNGVNWQNIGLGGRDVFYILVNPEDDIFATTEYGLFMKDHNNNNWIKMEEGLQRSGVVSMSVDSNGYVFLGTVIGGVFRSSVSTISVKSSSNEIPAEFSLGQNFPNPFNPVTSIKFEIPVLSNVKIVVYDALGKEVQELLNQKISPGTYEVKWDADKFASGVYFYSLQTDKFTQTKKMVLIK